MITIKSILSSDADIIDDVSEIHLKSFKGFFLTFMGKGFLKLMYRSYTEHRNSGVIVAFEDNKPVGFLAYSGELSGLYKYMIKKRLVPFAWYSFLAFLKNPSIFMRLLRALLKPNEAKREEKFVELASIGVSPDASSKGIGSQLIDYLKARVDFSEYEYISLETDAENNEAANRFYLKNGFVKQREFETHEGRKMNEYRFRGNI